MPNVSVNLDVTVDASGSLSLFANNGPTMSNMGGAAVMIDAGYFYKSGEDGLLRFQSRPTTGTDSSMYAERYAPFTGTSTELADAFKAVLAGEFDVSTATPFKTYSSDYHTTPNFGSLTLQSYAHALFGHVQATAAINNDQDFISKMIGDGPDDAKLNIKLANAIFNLSSDKAVAIVKQVLGQDATRTRKGDNTQAYPDNWQALVLKPGDTIYVSIRLQPPTVVIGNGQQSGPSASLFTAQTYSIKIVLGGTVTADEPIFSYNAFPAMTQNETTVNQAVVTSGGPVVSYSINPALPAGLSFNETTGLISGTPTVDTSNQPLFFTVTGTNSGGTGTFSFSLTIAPQPPQISYADPFVFTAGTPVNQSLTVPTSSRGSVSSYTVSTNHTLPAGLSLNETTGVIGGTVSGLNAVAQASYDIIATNSAGSYTDHVIITVNAATPDISYPTAIDPQILVVGTPVSFALLNNGGPWATLTISPDPPAGLTMGADGTISGTPTAVMSGTQYTVTATNPSGSSGAILELAVNPMLPAISYTAPGVFTVGTPITPFSPTSTGGPIDSYSGVLPPGIDLNPLTGEISGTPTAEMISNDFIVYATNATGTTQTIINIAVNNIPPVISYPQSSYVFTTGSEISALIPTNTGGSPVVYTCPDLPDGLNLNGDTGYITGTPSVVEDSNYTITATGSAGSNSFSIGITINPPPPFIQYGSPSYGFSVGDNVDGVTASNYGGAVTSFTYDQLPAGASMNSSTGEITGILTTAVSNFVSVITASNGGGSSTFTITFNVLEVAPTISYSPTIMTFNRGATFVPIVPTLTGNITLITVAPALPLDLQLNSQTGIISGIPTVAAASAVYRITATNTAGSSFVDITVAVTEIPPSIAYQSSLVAVAGAPITAIESNNTGGAATYTSSPSLPLGFFLNPATGVISTPTFISSNPIVSPGTNFTITATNTGGTSSSVINIIINPAAPDFAYTTTNMILTKGSVMTPNAVQIRAGSLITYSMVDRSGEVGVPTNYSPTLPAGLDYNRTTGVIFGTPTAVISSPLLYSMTGTNVTGSYTTTFTIKVNDATPSFSYPIGSSSINPIVFNKSTNSAGAGPTANTSINYTISPGVPSGLNFHGGTGVISGAPFSTKLVGTAYTVTGTNSTGQTGTASVFIRVDAAPPTFSYTQITGGTTAVVPGVQTTLRSNSSYPYTVTFTNTAPVTRSFTCTPPLPASLSFSTATGNITASGTAFTSIASAIYAIQCTDTSASPNVSYTYYIKISTF